MGSSRLPGKIIKPLQPSNVLTYVTTRCMKIRGVDEVIVATSVLSKDDEVENWCEEHGVTCYRGSEEDVLDRYVQAAKPYEPDYVMRVTADCPFVDFAMATEIVELMGHERVDIIHLEGKLPRGLAVELISYEALVYIHEHGQEPRHREHVTYYAYENNEEFRHVVYQVPQNRLYPQLRITLDTVEDYALCSAVANHFENELVPSEEVVKFLLAHPEIAQMNAHIEQKPVV